MKQKTTPTELLQIPGIGKSIAKDLQDLGIYTISDLKNKDPEKLYEAANNQKGVIQDRCLLYTFRCAVYFASHKTHDPKLLKWWNWKDNTSH
jgi:hypothetical protein